MNENDLERNENNKNKFLSLKEENEDNLIENTSKTDNLLEKIEEKEFNEPSKYMISYTNLIEYITKPKKKNIDDQNELIANLLLIPSDISLIDKASTLSCLSDFYSKQKRYEHLIRNAIEFEKMLKIQKDLNCKYYLNCFYKTSYILWENYQNFFYSLKYINKCNIVSKKMKDKITKEKSSLIQNNMELISQATISYLADKKTLFLDESCQERAEKINDLINSIMSKINNKETDENDENKKYLYVINKDWILSLISFIKPFMALIAYENNKFSNSIQKIFEFSYTCESYINENEKEKKTNINYNSFPGPIDNFIITSFKDCWKDKDNLDENDYIKKNSEFFLVNYEDWNFLSSSFGYTNIIRRKKNNLDLISFKFVLLDKRIQVGKQNLKLLKERYIQVNKGIKIMQLKEKILRCADNELEPNEEEKQFCFYLLDRNKGEILIEVIFAYGSSIPIYESLYIKKIELKDEENLDFLFSIFDKKKYFLIIEIIQKGEINYLLQIEQDNYKCNICGSKIKDEKEIYKCQLCHFSLFCSRNCANNSDTHRLLNKSMRKLMEEKFNLADILSDKYNYLLKSGNQGRTHILVDSQDETFFISSIHCLSHTLALTKYFISNIYRQEQKSMNSNVSDFYYKLINALWEGGDRAITISVSTFCDRIGLKYNPNIEPFDFIFKFFEKLNEELNRASGDYKKDIEGQKEGESDEDTSKRFISNYKKKTDSIITDLFVGQFKETITCINCGNKYIKFPNFFYANLPVPDKKLNIQIKLFTKNLNFYYVNIKMNENTEMKDILLKSIDYLQKNSYIKYLANTKHDEGIFNLNITDIPENILYNHLQFVEINKDFKIVQIYNTSYKNTEINNNNIKSFDHIKYKDYKENMDKKSISELVIYEIGSYSNKPNFISIFVYPIGLVDKEVMFYGHQQYHKILTYPVVITVNKNEPLDNLKILIFGKLKKALMAQFQNELNSIEIFYPHFGESWENLKMKDRKCPICQKIYTKSVFCCNLFEAIDKSTTIECLLEKQPKNRPLILYAKSDIYERNKCIYKGMELSFDKANEIATKDVINIYDSLDSFNHSKKITDEKWFCKICNKNGIFRRKINLYKLPNYLIIQIKKGKSEKTFQYKEILDLKEYVLNPDKEESTLYDLYAVILHKKSINSSSYSSYCKNFRIWICFNKEEMDYIPNPISKDAHILFYKRRNIE